MIIKFEDYNPEWTTEFDRLKTELFNLISFLNAKIEHIGSTSVEGLSAKPIIVILVGLNSENDLDKTVNPLIDYGYIHYSTYNEIMPYRRFFIKHKMDYSDSSIPRIIMKADQVPTSAEKHNNRLTHIHILPIGSKHWTRHIAFRYYLRTPLDIKNEYQKLKETLIERKLFGSPHQHLC